MSEITTTNTIEKFQAEATKTLVNTSSSTDIGSFIEICKATQSALKASLKIWAEKIVGEDKIEEGDGYLFIRGEQPVLLTAHMDTVHTEKVRDTYEFEIRDENGKPQHIITSPQGIGGDDRCGIYMIIKLMGLGYRPYILFCEDEEIGGVGSNKFIKTELIKEIEGLKFYIELDRASANDAVYYSCGNEEFEEFINKTIGYETNYGSFSDISHLSPETDVASVNLSCGYYKAHSNDEYVNFEEMEDTISAVEMLIEEAAKEETPGYDYQAKKSTWGSNYDYSGWYDKYYGSHRYSYLDDDDYDRDYKSNSGFRKSYALLNDDIPFEYTGYFCYMDEEENEFEEKVTGDSKLSCIAKFLMATGISWNDVLDYYFDYD